MREAITYIADRIEDARRRYHAWSTNADYVGVIPLRRAIARMEAEQNRLELFDGKKGRPADRARLRPARHEMPLAWGG